MRLKLCRHFIQDEGNYHQMMLTPRQCIPRGQTMYGTRAIRHPISANSTSADIDSSPVVTAAVVVVALVVVVAIVVFAPEVALPALAFGLL